MKIEIMVKIHAEIMKPPGLQTEKERQRENVRSVCVCVFLLNSQDRTMCNETYIDHRRRKTLELSTALQSAQESAK